MPKNVEVKERLCGEGCCFIQQHPSDFKRAGREILIGTNSILMEGKVKTNNEMTIIKEKEMDTKDVL